MLSRSTKKIFLYFSLISAILNGLADINWFINQADRDYITVAILIFFLLYSIVFGELMLSHLRDLRNSELMESRTFNGEAQKPDQLKNELMLTHEAQREKELTW